MKKLIRDFLIKIGWYARKRQKKCLLPIEEPPKKILVLATSRGLGDMVLQIPSFNCLVKRFPEALIDVLATSHWAPLVQHYSGINKVITRTRCRFYEKDFFTSLYQIRKGKYDLLIDLVSMGNYFESALLSFLSQIPVTVGYAFSDFGFFYNCAISGDDKGKHIAELKKGLIDSLTNFAPEPIQFDLTIKAEIVSKLKNKLINLGIDPEHKIIGLHPFAGFVVEKMEKRLPFKTWHKIGKALLARNYQVLILGSSEEKAQAQKLAYSIEGKVINLAGELDVLETVALVWKIDLLICNNSGLLHAAVAVSTPTISIDWPSEKHQIRWGPYRHDQTPHKVISFNPCSSSCDPWHCDILEKPCITGIKAETILESVEEILK